MDKILEMVILTKVGIQFQSGFIDTRFHGYDKISE